MKKILLGLFLLLMVAGRVDAANKTVYVDTDVVGGTGDGSSWANAYATLAACEDAEDGVAYDTGETCTINCRGTTADTTAVTFAGWDADVSVSVVGDWSGNKWDSTKYRIDVIDATNIVLGSNAPKTMVFRGVQIKTNGNGYGATVCFNVQSSGTNTYTLDRCFLTGKRDAWYTIGVQDDSYSGGQTINVRNCIFYNFITEGNNKVGFGYSQGTVNLDNVTFYDCRLAVARSSGTYTIRNCLFSSCTTDATGTISDTYCASSNDNTKGLSAGGTGNRFSQTFTFSSTTSTTTGFLHLASNDAGARDFGADLSGTFSDDVDGTTRSGTWDIGADEYVAASPSITVMKIILGE